MWVRGLKLVNRRLDLTCLRSHPMWVRGLKHVQYASLPCWQNVAPHVGAWIETLPPVSLDMSTTSHPMWVRGLKLPLLLIMTVI